MSRTSQDNGTGDVLEEKGPNILLETKETSLESTNASQANADKNHDDQINEQQESKSHPTPIRISDEAGTLSHSPLVSDVKKSEAPKLKYQVAFVEDDPEDQSARVISGEEIEPAKDDKKTELPDRLAAGGAKSKKEKGKETDVGGGKEVKPTIKFKDAVGRKFTFPFHMVKTWAGMEELIKQAFLHIDVIGPHVAEGHYDLVNPDGEIILPQAWELSVEPGWNVTMHMWPLPEPPSGLPPRRPVNHRERLPSKSAASAPGGVQAGNRPGGPPPPSQMRGGPPPPPPANWPGGPPRPPPTIVNLAPRPPGSVRKPQTETSILPWLSGKSGKPKKTARQDTDDDESEKLKPRRVWTLGPSLDDIGWFQGPPPKPPKTLFSDDEDPDSSYQVAQSMFQGKCFQAFDFKVLMMWDLLRLQREVVGRWERLQEHPEDTVNAEAFFETLAEYRTALRDWQEIERFPRSSRDDVKIFDHHLLNQLKGDDHKKLCDNSKWLGNVINLKMNEEKAASKVRTVLQHILPDRLSMSLDEAQYEEQLSALALGPGRVKDIESQSFEAPEIQQPKRKEAYSPFVDALARLLISISGGLLLIIPMVVLVIVTPLYWRVGIVSIAVLLFAVAVSQMSKASNQELLTSVAAYAAVLTVFFGQIG